MSDFIAAGSPPAERSPYDRSAFEETVSVPHASPAAFVEDLARRISEKSVIRLDLVRQVLAEAQYEGLIVRAFQPTADEYVPPSPAPRRDLEGKDLEPPAPEVDVASANAIPSDFWPEPGGPPAAA